jgi:acyl carrier protein
MIMTTALLLEEIKGALAEVLNMEENHSITLNTSLFDELHLDSTSVLELLMTLEDRIDGLEIDPDELEPDVFNTVGSLAAYIEKQLVAA